MVEVILLLIQCERLQKFSNLRVQAVAELRKVILVNREQRSYAWMLTDSGVKSSYLIGWHAHFHGYGHLWWICRFRISVWAFWLNHLKKFCTVIGLYFDGFAAWGIRQHGISVYLWVTISNVYYYERFLPAISGNIFDNVQFAEKNIDASRTNFVDKLLSGAINNTSRSLARNFGAESYC